MNFRSHRIPYRQTGYFTPVVLDYIDQQEALKPFYRFSPGITGFKDAVSARMQFRTNRAVLTSVLREQYEGLPVTKAVQQNIDLLEKENCFTVCTAHQPNLFTGPLYVVYKILHCIKLAEYLGQSMPENHFVPVFYMGCEDADLAELGHVWLMDEKLEWATGQRGAVGRMKVDSNLLSLIDRMEGMLGNLPYGPELIEHLRSAYLKGSDVQQSTLRLMHQLFGEKGLVVLIPDHQELKRTMISVFSDELLNETASGIVEKTSEQLGRQYKVQAHPREINLFYLKDDIRERIIKADDGFVIQHTGIKFSKDEMLAELESHPERFSPNVILRGLLQETLLPNIAFIGGGGELAYWLQLADLFDHYQIPFPALVLRNSLMLVESKWRSLASKLKIAADDLFGNEEKLINNFVQLNTENAVQLNGTLDEAANLYETARMSAVEIDPSLGPHVEALKKEGLKKLRELEKKMIRAEKRKFGDQRRQISKLKNALFPGGGLQERRESILYFYAIWGKAILDTLYEASLAAEGEFVIIEETI